MANLNFIDKLLIEDVFGMKSGYVLDFSNRTFDEFMQEVMGESIYSKYEYMSKANLLRQFISDYSDSFVGKMLLIAITYMQSNGMISDDNAEQIEKLKALGQRLLGRSVKQKVQTVAPDDVAPNTPNFKKLAKCLMEVDVIKNPQKRGYAFEEYLKNLFDEFSLDAHASYRTDTDQIDGSFLLNGSTVLLEAKYRTSDLSKNDLILFENKITRKSAFARGLFVSLSDFDETVVNYFKDRSARFIALSVSEIYLMCEREYDFRTVLTKKFRYLDEYGIIYRNINYLF